MRSLSRVLVIGLTVATLTLAAAVGVSAGSGTFGSSHAAATVTHLVTGNVDLGFLHQSVSQGVSATANHGQDKEKGQCHEPKKHHHHGTPGHKNHPCGDGGDDTD